MLFARHFIPFFCQKVLPTVYDNSLSYYEFLCKMYRELCKYIELNDRNVESLALKVEDIESPDGLSDVVIRCTVDSQNVATITASTKEFNTVLSTVRENKAVLMKLLYTYESEGIEAPEHVALLRAEGNYEQPNSLTFSGVDAFLLKDQVTPAELFKAVTFSWLPNGQGTLITRTNWLASVDMLTSAVSGLASETYVNNQIATAVTNLATQSYVDAKTQATVERYNVLERASTNTEMFAVEVGSHLYKTGHMVAGSIGYALRGAPERGTLIANNFPVPAGTMYTFIGHKLSSVEAERDHVIVARLFAGAPAEYPTVGNGALLWWYGNAQAGDVIFFDVAYVSSGNLG